MCSGASTSFIAAASEPKTPALQDNSDCVDKWRQMFLMIATHSSKPEKKKGFLDSQPNFRTQNFTLQVRFVVCMTNDPNLVSSDRKGKRDTSPSVFWL